MGFEFYFYPLDVDSDANNVRLFGITKEHRRLVLSDKTFSPYFYVIPSGNPHELADKLRSLSFLDGDGTQVTVHDARIAMKSVGGAPVAVIKVIASKPTDVLILRSKISQITGVSSCEEFDIRFYRRYLFDKGITPLALCRAKGTITKQEADCDFIELESIEPVDSEPNSDLKIFAFDIETLCTRAFPDPEHDAVIFASLYGKGFQKVLTWKRFEGAPDYVQFVNGELELLEELKKTLFQQKPDVLIGYGSDHFDFPFLAKRAKKYGISLNLGFDNSDVEISKRGLASAQINGLQHLDISHFVRNILDLNTDRFKLDLVASELLGKGKLFKLNAPKINEVWQVGLAEELKGLADYNLIDSQLAYEIFMQLLPTQLQLVKLIGLPLSDINRMSYGQLVEWFLIKNAKNFDLIVPKKPASDEIYSRSLNTYSGAFVFEPTPGFYQKVVVFDFRSLYPSIIASHNISPEKINCKCCEHHGGHRIEDSGIWFCSKNPGFIPSLVQDVIDRRKRISAILEQTSPAELAFQELKARQYALKTIANSSYGYLGFPGSRWYSLECAQAITSLGRKYIQMVIKEAEKFGFKTLYGDTDSLFVLLDDKSLEESKKFLSVINSVLPQPMELEYRDFYPAALFIGAKAGGRGAKKRYALLTKNGGLILKGVEAIRGDWSALAKKAQKIAIELILKEGGPNNAAKYVQELISKIKTRKIALEDLFIHVRLTKPIPSYELRGPHVAAAELAARKGYIVRAGFEVSYIVVNGSGKVSERVMLAEDAKLEDYDPEYYIEHQILRAVYKLFELFNYPTEKLKAGQTTLGEEWNST